MLVSKLHSKSRSPSGTHLTLQGKVERHSLKLKMKKGESFRERCTPSPSLCKLAVIVTLPVSKLENSKCWDTLLL